MSQSARFRRILPCLTLNLMVVLGSMGGPAPAWAWGDLGHKIVCQIAFQELNNKARAEVTRLIALDENRPLQFVVPNGLPLHVPAVPV